jgi:long-chain acyl-CoA synthetase
VAAWPYRRRWQTSGNRSPANRHAEAYGLTETSPAATINPLDMPAYNGSIGLPISSTEVSIRDDNGNDVPPRPAWRTVRSRSAGDEGLLQSSGRDRQGDACRTVSCGPATGGDGRRGFVRMVDRKKDMILVSGFNVYPNEVEDVVAQHPGVLEVAAVGVPDDKSGEAVKIFVVKKDPALTAEALIASLPRAPDRLQGAEHMSSSATDLPKTNVGKILRRELRDEAIKKT